MDMDSLAVVVTALATAIGVQAATMRYMSSNIVHELQSIKTLLSRIHESISEKKWGNK